jgi:hypothetical protein
MRDCDYTNRDLKSENILIKYTDNNKNSSFYMKFIY